MKAKPASEDRCRCLSSGRAAQRRHEAPHAPSSCARAPKESAHGACHMDRLPAFPPPAELYSNRR
eukprot:CAMPEP_0197930566 /NCGR_PEP_ID=MMETSP1439-20131203/105683_1 /TAXON_ID=66791 /ORGANISM="Gonyaulax spinifera, Strain CCMP409" /LENGTH=64 /DNA_ID=CAMNT_0043553261 /DNA_START=56 /DNA_END=250 /DNA_ORIENTATION=-